MISNLAQWYTRAKLKGPDTEKLQKRITVIEDIVKEKSFEWILDCLRIFLNKEIRNPEFKQEFITIFIASDPYFPPKKNELEVKILSGAIIYHYAKFSKGKDKLILLQAIRTGIFGKSKGDFLNYDIISDLVDQLNDESISIRENNKKEHLKFNFEPSVSSNEITELTQKFTNLNEKIKTFAANVNGILARKIGQLEEEANIHWWIFRGVSNITKEPFSEIDLKELPFILGTELSSLTNFSPGPYSADQFILKVLIDSGKNDNEISIKDFVNKIADSKKGLHFAKPGILGNLIPLHSAISEAKEKDDKTSWIQSFESECSIKSTEKTSLKSLAFQWYNETLIVNHFEN